MLSPMGGGGLGGRVARRVRGGGFCGVTHGADTPPRHAAPPPRHDAPPVRHDATPVRHDATPVRHDATPMRCSSPRMRCDYGACAVVLLSAATLKSPHPAS